MNELIKRGVVAIPFDDRKGEVLLLPGLEENGHKFEWVVGSAIPKLLPVLGDEFPGGVVDPADGLHGGRRSVKQLTKIVATNREIGEECKRVEGPRKLVDLQPGFFILHKRPSGIGLYLVSVSLWNLSEIQREQMLELEGAIPLNRNQVVNNSHGRKIRPRDQKSIEYARNYLLKGSIQ